MSEAEATPRVEPFYCPYCSEEDLVPDGTEPASYHCGSCNRLFVVKFLGMGSSEASGESDAV